MQKLKKQNGITLIALIITIIVMLILVGVSVTVALKGGLFTAAKNAANNTRAERDNELAISNGDIIDQYLSGAGNGSGTGTGTEYKIGDEVIVNEEPFFVIGFEGANDEKVILLAKYNLDESATAQDTDGVINGCEFSTEGEFAGGDDLNESEKLKLDTASAVYKVMQYEEKFETDVKARLMTYTEAYELSQSENEKILEMLYGTYSEEGFLNYWLNSVMVDGSPNAVWSVLGKNEEFNGEGGIGTRDYRSDDIRNTPSFRSSKICYSIVLN